MLNSLKSKIKTSVGAAITRKPNKTKKHKPAMKTDLKLLENMTTLPKLDEDDEDNEYEENLMGVTGNIF